MDYGIWTDDRLEQLKTLRTAGLSAGRIADEMGCFGYCQDGGRNAVIGKIFRLKLTLPFGEARRRMREGALLRNARRVSTVARLTKPASQASSAAPLAPEIPDDERYGPYIQVRHLTDENCHFALGDPREPNFGFCGAPAVEGKPFCARHCELVYQPPYCRYRADKELLST